MIERPPVEGQIEFAGAKNREALKSNETLTLPEQVKLLVKLIDQRIRQAWNNPENEFKFLEYSKYTLTAEDLADREEKINQFNDENDLWSEIWHSQECRVDREIEKIIYGSGEKPVKVFKVKCIDGRKPRPIEGEADSLKTEEGKIALDKIDSTGEIIPLQQEIITALQDLSYEPLEISLSHYDSSNDEHGCAAIRRLLNEKNRKILIEELGDFLSLEELKLLTEAQKMSFEEANIILHELTNNQAFLNVRNNALEKAGLPKIKRVAVAALFDTRTMGMELRTGLLDRDDEGNLLLAPKEKHQTLSTTKLTNLLKEEIIGTTIDGLPEFGSFEENYNSKEGFKQYSRALTILSVILYDPDNFNHYLGQVYHRDFIISDQVKEAITKVHNEVVDFIYDNFADLSPNQRRILGFRFFRSISHQFLTGLSEYKNHHAFSDHEEQYISTSEDANYPGKLVASRQSFRINSPDPETGAKRDDIAASVMDKTKIGGGR